MQQQQQPVAAAKKAVRAIDNHQERERQRESRQSATLNQAEDFLFRKHDSPKQAHEAEIIEISEKGYGAG